MVRHALRRLLWLLPTLFFLTLASFALLSYVPDPADDERLAMALGHERVEELRRSRFLDLPRFFNPSPRDLRVQIDEILEHLVADGEETAQARATLVRLGGASLPYLLPRLDGLDPPSRAKVASALAPLSERMGIASDESRDEARAAAFWARFWADRESDFRPVNARRAVRRLSLGSTTMREADLRVLDTFALGELLAEIKELAEADDLERLGRVIDMTAKITGRDDTLAKEASLKEARACARRWLDWWLANRADYAVHDGPARLSATVLDTQYARWFERMISLRLGTGTDGVEVIDKLRARAPVTFAISALSVLAAYAIALPLGIVSALRRGLGGRALLLIATLASHALPTACLAVLVAASAPQSAGIVLPALVLAVAFIASPARHQHARLIETLQRDFILAARARGLGPLRVLRHALRESPGATLTLFSLDLPMALAGSFVVEKAFGIEGIGAETVRAVQTRDVAWLMTLGFSAAAIGALALIASDLTLSFVDPRVRAGIAHDGRVSR